MNATMNAGIWLDPPVHAVAHGTSIPLVLSAILAVGSVIFGVVYTRRTGSPLYFWAAVSGWLLYPLFVEPMGDWFVAVWYPTNLDIAATVFDRPMPWFAVLFYGAGIPFVTVAAYEIVQRGLPARRLLWLVVVVNILEVPLEMLGSHLGWMNYYGNHAVVFGVPVYCFVQNGGMFAVVAWTLAWLLPRVHGWRWVVVPFAIAATLPVFALLSTWPAYLAIHTGAGPVVGWIAGIVSVLLNAAIVIACVYSPQLRRLRDTVADSPQAIPATV